MLYFMCRRKSESQMGSEKKVRGVFQNVNETRYVSTVGSKNNAIATRTNAMGI